MLSSDSYITKVLSRLLQHSQGLQHNLCWQEGDLGCTMIRVHRSCGKRNPPGLSGILLWHTMSLENGMSYELVEWKPFVSQVLF